MSDNNNSVKKSLRFLKIRDDKTFVFHCPTIADCLGKDVDAKSDSNSNSQATSVRSPTDHESLKKPCAQVDAKTKAEVVSMSSPVHTPEPTVFDNHVSPMVSSCSKSDVGVQVNVDDKAGKVEDGLDTSPVTSKKFKALSDSKLDTSLPDDWKVPEKKEDGNAEPGFKDVDNPDNWNDLVFRPVYKKQEQVKMQNINILGMNYPLVVVLFQ